MLVLLSPSKTLTFRSPWTQKGTQPELLTQTKKLVKELRALPLQALADLMQMSESLAEENHRRYRQFRFAHNKKNSHPAILSYSGGTYVGLDADHWVSETIDYAQTHLRILSGLYGILKPLDLIQPYRLEMGGRFQYQQEGLYSFWKKHLTKMLNRDLAACKASVLLNLASDEYWKVVDENALHIPVIKADFREKKGNQYKFISFNAKKARGQMARFVVENEIKSIGELIKFDVDGYIFNESLSSKGQLMFIK